MLSRRWVAALIFVAIFAPPLALAQSSQKVQDAVDVIVLMCVAGGSKVELEASGQLEGGLALKRLGASGRADIKLNRTEVRGLVEGLQGAMNNIAGQQASEARNCMKPYIDRILKEILGDVGAPNFHMRHQIEYLLASLENFSISRDGHATVRLALRNTSERGSGLAMALKAEHSDGIADFWKFFPQSMARLSDDRGNRYRVTDISPIGYARTEKDWTILRAGQTTTLTASFIREQNDPNGQKFDVSVPIRLVWVPSGETQQRVSSYDIYLKGMTP